MHVRRAAERDIPAIERLLLQVLNIHAEGRPDLFKPNTTKYTAEELEEILSAHTTDTKLFDRAVEIMEEAGSIEFAREFALREVAEAKAELCEKLGDSHARELLLAMADFFVSRVS
jgi:geranylgeranyl pyrophosphate synthase